MICAEPLAMIKTLRSRQPDLNSLVRRLLLENGVDYQVSAAPAEAPRACKVAVSLPVM